MSQAPDPASAGDDASHGAARDQSRDQGGERFAMGRPLAAASAGPVLAAALAGTRVGLGGLSDDALAGFLGGCHKITAWAAGMLMEGIAEYADRRPDDRFPGRATLCAAAAKAARAAGQPADPPGCDEFAPDELMPVLRLSKGGAARQVELALALRYRLHATLAAMLDGQIDLIRARIIAEATAELSPAHAAEVEALVLPRAGKQTYIALGIALGQAVLVVDPKAATRRRKKGEKRARVERWREYDGTGALAGRNLPPDDTLAADQALTDWALELREAGLDGPLDYLRATALIDRITGRDSRPAQDEHGPGEHDPDVANQDEEEDWDDRDEWPDRDRYILGQHGHEGRSDAADGGQDDPRQDDSGQDGGPGGTRPPGRPVGPRRSGGGGKNSRSRSRKRIAAQINLTLPLKTLLELGDPPGDAGPFGPLDPAAARDLARTAAAHPRTRWCVTVTDEDGHAVAHGCARGPRPWAGLTPRAGPGDGPTGAAAPTPVR